jgi:ABC-type multidrug transport system fused ATPase/permease subunit
MDDMDMFVFKKTGSADKSIKLQGNEFSEIIKYYPSKLIVAISGICSVAAGAMPLALIWIVSSSFQSVLEPETMRANMEAMLMNWIIIAVLMVIVTSAAFALRAYANPAFVDTLRSALFERFLEQEIEFFDEISTGILLSRLSEDITFVLDTYIEKVQICIQYSSQIIFAILFSFIICWRPSLIILFILPVSTVTYFIGEHCVNKLWLQFRDRSNESSTHAEEILTGFRTVKSFDNEIFETERYSEELTSVHEVVVQASHVHAIKNGLMYLFTLGTLAPVVYWTGYIILKQPWLGVEIGSIVLLLICISNVGQGMQQCITSMDDLRQAGYSAAKLLQILNRKPSVNRNEGNSINSAHVNGKIEFRDVCFKYKTRDDYAVQHLSFTINAGETVALVGESGCGKTTTIQLLQRFYEIESGSILIDDVDIKTLSGVNVWSHIATVPQTPTLFSMSVLDNLRFGKSDATEDEVTSAAQIGNAHDFIMELSDNYKTEVRQTSLSGGQKQRICISRAILANTPVLLLDEATAALDTESEQLVQQSLDRFRHGKTAIIVAHRLATVQSADRILVFQNGHVAESGTHEELLAANGIYADLIRFQLQ